MDSELMDFAEEVTKTLKAVDDALTQLFSAVMALRERVTALEAKNGSLTPHAPRSRRSGPETQEGKQHG